MNFIINNNILSQVQVRVSFSKREGEKRRKGGKELFKEETRVKCRRQGKNRRQCR
jgi:hypothetical protein